MEIMRCTMPSFAVIGKEGSTEDGVDFIAGLWADANAHFDQVAHLAQKNEHGQLAGIWGAMSDPSRSFQPWEDHYTRGLYLAGVQCGIDQLPPEGWIKWVIPAYEYLYVENNEKNTFEQMLWYMEQNDFSLVGAVHDFVCPETGKNFMFFPIRKM